MCEIFEIPRDSLFEVLFVVYRHVFEMETRWVGQSLVVLATGIIRLFTKVSALFNVLQKGFVFLH